LFCRYQSTKRYVERNLWPLVAARTRPFDPIDYDGDMIDRSISYLFVDGECLNHTLKKFGKSVDFH